MDLRKVYGGTPVGTESRCDTCSYARIITGYSEKERIVFCDYAYPTVNIPFKVYECSDYADKRLPRLDDLKKIALPVEVRGRSAGFLEAPITSLLLQDDDDE